MGSRFLYTPDSNVVVVLLDRLSRIHVCNTSGCWWVGSVFVCTPDVVYSICRLNKFLVQEERLSSFCWGLQRLEEGLYYSPTCASCCRLMWTLSCKGTKLQTRACGIQMCAVQLVDLKPPPYLAGSPSQGIQKTLKI
jgi:hypothetical protein